jgi:hypothetical protein
MPGHFDAEIAGDIPALASTCGSIRHRGYQTEEPVSQTQRYVAVIVVADDQRDALFGVRGCRERHERSARLRANAALNDSQCFIPVPPACLSTARANRYMP